MNAKDLVDDRLVLGAIQDGLEILHAKIANTNALQFPFVLERLKNFPEGLQLAWESDEWVMDEEKIGDKTELFDGGSGELDRGPLYLPLFFFVSMCKARI